MAYGEGNHIFKYIFSSIWKAHECNHICKFVIFMGMYSLYVTVYSTVCVHKNFKNTMVNQ